MGKIIAINRNHHFKRLYNKGNSVVNPYFVLYVKRNGKPLNRLGITVSKKVGNAVQRNRARRRLKEIYRLNSHSIRQGFDIVLVARGRAINGNYQAMTECFRSGLKKARLI